MISNSTEIYIRWGNNIYGVYMAGYLIVVAVWRTTRYSYGCFIKIMVWYCVFKDFQRRYANTKSKIKVHWRLNYTSRFFAPRRGWKKGQTKKVRIINLWINRIAQLFFVAGFVFVSTEEWHEQIVRRITHHIWEMNEFTWSVLATNKPHAWKYESLQREKRASF